MTKQQMTKQWPDAKTLEAWLLFERLEERKNIHTSPQHLQQMLMEIRAKVSTTPIGIHDYLQSEFVEFDKKYLRSDDTTPLY